MLFIATCLISILIAFYYQTEKGFYNEFARQNEALSRAVQVAMEKTAGRAPADFTTLDNYLRQLDIRAEAAQQLRREQQQIRHAPAQRVRAAQAA